MPCCWAPTASAAVEDQLAERVLSQVWAPVRLVVGALGGDAAVRGAAMRAVRPVSPGLVLRVPGARCPVPVPGARSEG
jgi:hypothetical protein